MVSVTEREALRRRRLARFVTRLDQLSLSRGLRAWLATSSSRADALRLLRVCALRLAHQSLARGFASWCELREAAAQRLLLRAVMERR